MPSDHRMNLSNTLIDIKTTLAVLKRYPRNQTLLSIMVQALEALSTDLSIVDAPDKTLQTICLQSIHTFKNLVSMPQNAYDETIELLDKTIKPLKDICTTTTQAAHTAPSLANSWLNQTRPDKRPCGTTPQLGTLHTEIGTLSTLIDQLSLTDDTPVPVKKLIDEIKSTTYRHHKHCLEAKMMSISNILQIFPAIIDQCCFKLDRDINLSLKGTDTPIDIRIVNALKSPLIKLLQYCAIYNIEAVAERLQEGKTAQASLQIKVRQSGNVMIMEFIDDGRGIDPDIIRKELVLAGVMSQETANTIPESKLFEYSMLTTKNSQIDPSKLQEYDIHLGTIKHAIEHLGGSLNMRPTPNQGSRFIVKIPYQETITEIVAAQSNKTYYAIAKSHIRKTFKLTPNLLSKLHSKYDTLMITIDDITIPLVNLSDYTSDPQPQSDLSGCYVILCHATVRNRTFGIIVDIIERPKEQLIFPMPSLLSHLNIYSGITKTYDNDHIMCLLNPDGIVESINELCFISKAHEAGAFETDAPKAQQETKHFYLIVELNKQTKAIPLEHIESLEYCDAKALSLSLEHCHVTYQDQVIPLVPFHEDCTLNNEGIIEFIVCKSPSAPSGYEAFYIDRMVDIATVSRVDPECNHIDYLDQHYPITMPPGLSAHSPHANNNSNIRTQDTILLIDHSPFFSRWIPPELNAAGFNVMTVATIEDAVPILSKSSNSLHAILVDIPNDSVDLSPLVTPSHTPIIAMSSTSFSDQQIQTLQEKGARHCLNKTSYHDLIDNLMHIAS